MAILASDAVPRHEPRPQCRESVLGHRGSIAVGDLPVDPVLQPLCALHVLPLEVAQEALQGEVARGPGDVPIVARDGRESPLPFADQRDNVVRQDVRFASSAHRFIECG